MYPISESAKARFLSGQKQIARLTVNNNPYESYKGEVYYSRFNTNVVWNQKLKDPHFEATASPKWRANLTYGTYTIGNNKLTYTITTKNANEAIVQDSVSFTQGHIYLTSFWITTSENQIIASYTGNSVANLGTVNANERTRIIGIFPSNRTGTRSHYIYVGRNGGIAVGGTAVLEDCCLYDLTVMFGEGKEYLGYMSFFNNFTENYYDYDESESTVPFDWTIYGGTLDVKTGVLTVTRAYIGGSDWEHYASSNGYKAYRIINALAPYSSASSSNYSVIEPMSNGISVFANFSSGSMTRNQIQPPIATNHNCYMALDQNADASTIYFSYLMNDAVTFQLSPTEVRTLLGYNIIWSDTGSVNLSYRNTSGEVVAKSGDIVSIDDGANNIPLESLSVSIVAKQTGEGTPSPSNIRPIVGYTEANITRTGKNLFDGGYINGRYDDNGQLRIQDGQYVAVIFDDIYQDTNLIVEGGKDYVISFDTIGIRGKDFYTLEFDKETGEYIRGTKTLRFTQQAGKTIPRYITVRPYFDSILVWYWDAGYGYDDEYNEEEFNEITMVTLPSQIVEDVVIRESDIVEGSLSINRYCTTGKSAMIGSCVASEMNVILNNENGNYNDVNFIGKDISVEVGTLDANDSPDFMPVGIFQVDDSPKKLEHISITALDRMMLLEKPLENLPYPTIVRYLYEDICSRTNVRRKTTDLWNGNYVVESPPENLQTYRDALSCLCEITGTCAYFDWDGRLCLEWFSSEEPTIELTTANRIVSDLAEESVQITGVEVKSGEETYLAGTDEYTLSVAQNPLVTHDAQALADALYGHLGWLSYRPFTATVLPMPYIYPMDMATFLDKDGNEILVAITDWTFRLNRNTELRGRGESSQQASFKKKYGIGENGADIDEALGILRDTIIKNAEIINQQMETIERTLHGQYEALSSEFGSYRNETDAKITANAEGITQAYTNIEEIDSKYGVAITDTNQAIVQVADGAVATNTKFRELTEAYIKSGKLYYEGTTPVYGVAVGQLTYEQVGGDNLIKRQGVYSVFTSEELAFYINDVKVAYMRNKKLYINEAEFVNKVNIGNFSLEDGTNGFTIK